MKQFINIHSIRKKMIFHIGSQIKLKILKIISLVTGSLRWFAALGATALSARQIKFDFAESNGGIAKFAAAWKAIRACLSVFANDSG
jgi:hypothetical protein